MANTLTWLGHAALSLQIDEIKILVDPYLTGNPQAVVKADEVQAEYILVTHGHGDHVGDAVAIAKRTGATVISNAEICGWLGKQGIKTHGQHLGGGFMYPFGYLKMTYALHGSALPDGANGGNPGGRGVIPDVEQRSGAPQLRPVEHRRAVEDALGVLATDEQQKVVAFVVPREQRDRALDDRRLAEAFDGDRESLFDGQVYGNVVRHPTTLGDRDPDRIECRRDELGPLLGRDNSAH